MEVDPEEETVADRSATRTLDVVRRLTDADVQTAARRLTRAQQRALGQALGVPASVLTDRPGSARVLRSRTRGRRPTEVADLAHRLVDTTWNAVVDTLGDHADDPDDAQMRAAVDAVLPGHGVAAVALVLALCADGDFVAAPVAGAVLDTDTRLGPDAVGPVADDDASPGPSGAPTPSGRREADDAKKAERRARKDAERAARAQRGAATGPPRYKKAARPDAEPDDPTGPTDPVDAPGVTVGGRPVLGGTPRAVRPVGAHPDLDLDDPLVGRVVVAVVPFDDGVGAKPRPCVVLAASGRDHLVVRTCSSEGGVVSRDWKAFAVRDLVAAGLDGPTYVSDTERRIPRADVTRTLGWLATPDWNQL